MRNPYTGIEMRHPRPQGRLSVDYAFLGVLGVGVFGVLANVVFAARFAPAMAVSSVMVTVIYLEIGGYGWGRARAHRLRGHPGANHDLAIVAGLVGAWDVVSPVALGDASALAIALHATAGALVVGLAAVAAWTIPADVPSMSAPQP